MLDYARIEARETVIQSSIALGEFQATDVTIYLTLLFAYIAVAYIAGIKLTRIQLAITNFLFILVAAYEVVLIAVIGQSNRIKVAQIAEFG
jgi:hypothetical protein